MGWLYTHKPKSISASEFLLNHTGLFRWSEPCAYTYKVLDSGIVNLKTFYAAVEQVHKETGERRVWAAVILINFCRGEHNFGYKDMDESMGPVEAQCPKRILDLLTPTTYEYAIDWRARCRAYIAKREAVKNLEPGTMIDLWQKGYRLETKRKGGGWLARGESNGQLYMISAAKMAKAEVRNAAN